MAEHTSYNQFIQRYITSSSDDYPWQTTPLKVYPLEVMSEKLVLPTPLIRSEYHHLVFLSRGSYVHQMGISEYIIEAPSVMFLAEGEAFALKSLIGPVDGFLVLIDRKVIHSVLGPLDLEKLLTVEYVIHLATEQVPWFQSVCSLMFQEVSADSPSRGVSNGLLQALLHRLIVLSEKEKSNVSRSYQVASNFKKLLGDHLKNHKTVAFYSEQLNISENYLNRCVRETYGKSSKQVIQETAILQSQLLMFETRKDITEICFMMGFGDPSYFSRVFKKVTGQTPTQFRNSILHGLS